MAFGLDGSTPYWMGLGTQPTSFPLASFNGGASAYGASYDDSRIHENWALQVELVGAPGTIVVLEGSLSGNSFMALGSWQSTVQASGDIVFITNKPARFARAHQTSFNGAATSYANIYLGGY